MSQSVVQIDSFTAEPFAGNPAAVCLMDKAADERWMQLVAREMNLSETAFLYPIDRGYHLRWFTPKAEIELCGHATLATAHLLFEDGHVPADSVIHFETLSGTLTARLDGDWIELDFPANPGEPIEPSDALIRTVGQDVVAGVRDRTRYLAELRSEDDVRKAEPDMGLINSEFLGRLIITARAESTQADFVSRFFGPGLGVDEDPVTGAAHTMLAPYWSERLDKNPLLGYQASERGGFVRVRVDGDRVILGGRAVTVMRGLLE